MVVVVVESDDGELAGEDGAQEHGFGVRAAGLFIHPGGLGDDGGDIDAPTILNSERVQPASPLPPVPDPPGSRLRHAPPAFDDQRMVVAAPDVGLCRMVPNARNDCGVLIGRICEIRLCIGHSAVLNAL